jgi:hypothetical protein
MAGSGGSAAPAGSGGMTAAGTGGAMPAAGGNNVGGGGGGAGLGGSGGSGDSGGSGGSAGAGGGSGDGKIVLFDGSNLDAWQTNLTAMPVTWQIDTDKSLLVIPGTGNIITKQKFEDVFVHVEYKTPMLPANVTGQDRGNSGVYLKGMYEMQVLDTYGHQPEIDGCGAVYGVSKPITVACHMEEVWNTYDIEFKAPTYDAQGKKLTNAIIVSAKLNDVLVQQNVQVPGTTRAGNPEAPGPAGLMLQDHSNRVWYRNIWVIPR